MDIFSPPHVAGDHGIEGPIAFSTLLQPTWSAAMSNPLDDYLAALEARDAREKAHEAYVNACKKALCLSAECVGGS